MPVSLVSVASSQNAETKASFGSEIRSKRNLDKGLTEEEDDFRKL